MLKKKTYIFLLCCVALLGHSILFAQNNAITYTYEAAKQKAFSGIAGDRQIAKDICRKIKTESTDAAILLVRMYMWDSFYDSSRVVLMAVLAEKPNTYDALDAMIDLEYYDSNYQTSIDYCDKAITAYPDELSFKMKRAKALKELNRFDEAKLQLREVLAKDPQNNDALKLQESIKLASMKNRMTISYTIDQFEKKAIDPWHLLYLQYTRSTSMGSIVARINYANRFKTEGLQYEMDAYPRIAPRSYGYVNIGYSNASIFPSFRAGAEINHNFPLSIEGSIGFRFLNFTGSKVFIYTATLGKYFGNNWISARTYLTPSDIGVSVSGMLLGRHYFGNSESYIGLRGGYGISPDDRTKLLDSIKVSRTRYLSARIEWNQSINKYWTFNVGAIIANDEWYPHSYRYVYTYDISISRRF